MKKEIDKNAIKVQSQKFNTKRKERVVTPDYVKKVMEKMGLE